MTKVKLKQHASRKLVTDPEWELGMEVAIKYVAKKLAKMNCGAAMAEENFGMPAAEHFVYGAFDKLYTGVWYKIRSITTQSHGLKSSDFFGV